MAKLPVFISSCTKSFYNTSALASTVSLNSSWAHRYNSSTISSLMTVSTSFLRKTCSLVASIAHFKRFTDESLFCSNSLIKFFSYLSENANRSEYYTSLPVYRVVYFKNNGLASNAANFCGSLKLRNWGCTKLVVIEITLVWDSGTVSHVRSARLKLSDTGSFLSRMSSLINIKDISVYLLVRWCYKEWHSDAVILSLAVWNN